MINSIDIICAAADTPEELKRHASFLCDETDARPTLQRAIDEADRLDVSCVLLRGTYTINSCGERSSRGGICFFNPEEPQRFYAQNRARYHVLEGAKVPLGWLDGAVVTMGKDFYDSLPDDKPFSLFYSDGNSLFGRGLIIRNLVVHLPGSHKPVIVFDGRFASAVRYEDDWVTSFDPRGMNLATAEGIPVPHPDSVGFRGCCGSNFYSTEWKNCAVQGFGTGFDIGGEHVYCESLSALYNGCGFAFDCYKGKDSIDAPDDTPARGVCIYPVTCVNLLDEHNIHMPRFGNASHNGRTPEIHAQSITIHGMNLQWPNTCPGYTDRSAPDFLTGRHRATEAQPGSWRGTIEFVIDHTTPGSGCNLTDEPFFEEGHGTNVRVKNLHNPSN
ncbi:MAG: hypothetical protein IJ493_08060 [Clostridia bacterium]|nr:hypothetical protein [Clostridia bacterium]